MLPLNRLYHQVSKSLREASPSSSILPTQDPTTTWIAADPTGQTCIMEHEIVTTEGRIFKQVYLDSYGLTF